MQNLHTLSTKRIKPFSEGYCADAECVDFIIDGVSLYERMKKHGFIPSLGSGVRAYQEEMINYFLLEKPHPLLWYRIPILVCPACGDLECGYISAKVNRKGDIVVWKDFYKGEYKSKLNIGPFYFQWDNYQTVIRSTLHD